MHRRWVINRTNADYLSYLSRAASVSPVMAQVLVNRDIRNVSDARDFLNPSLSALSDPFDLPGMRQAVERIKAARQRGEKVLVHGDYDADGLTATAIAVSALRTAGLDAGYFIPHRMLHGYGFNAAGVEAAQKAGARLIITVDCGVGSFDAVELAGRRGVGVIITDHHEPARAAAESGEQDTGDVQNGVILPAAAAVVNPKCSPGASSLSTLSGAGLAFKLVQAMAHDRDAMLSPDDLLPLLDLVALGTIADVVPLRGENRVLTSAAMPYIQSGIRRGLHALKQAAGLDGRQMRSGMLSYTLIPRINAAGRMADAHDVVRLLLSDQEHEAYELASWLDRTNGERQRIEEVVFQEARAQLEGSGAETVILLADRGWHQGVLGIVASKLAEAYHVPAFIFSIDGDVAKGSGRSIPAFDICRGLGQCGDLLLSYGGHAQAAGVKLRAADLPEFAQRMRAVIRRDAVQTDMEPVLEIHAPVTLAEVDGNLMKEIEMLEPLGYGNPEPLFGAKNLKLVGPRVVGNRHLKVKVHSGPFRRDAIGFDMGNLINDLAFAAQYDAAFTPSYNEWNGARHLQLVLKGLRPSQK